MNKTSAFPIALMIALALTPVFSVHFPRALAFWPGFLGLSSAIWWCFVQKQKLVFPKRVFCAIGALCGLIVTSSLWSLSPQNALEKSLTVSAIILTSTILFRFLLSVPKGTLRPYFWFLPVGVILASLLCSFELYFGMPIYNATRDDGLNEIGTSVFNRGTVAIIFFFFVSWLFVKDANMQARSEGTLLGLMFISIILMLSLGQSQSAQLAFAGGILTMFLFPSRFQISFKILTFTLVILLALTPVIVHFLYQQFVLDIQNVEWLREAYAGHRIEIWNFVTNYAMNGPFYGYGIEAARYVAQYDHDYIYHTKETVLHPHNFAVQIWIEFGVLGVIAFAGLFYFICDRLAQIPHIKRPYAVALFFAVLSVSAFGYGMWQSWWIGLMMILVSLSSIAVQEDASCK